jgi:hypothetical protein
MKKRLRLVALVLVLFLGVIQFFHPEQNLGPPGGPNEIAACFAVPAEVQTLLVSACYDCHSNHTRYPWYARVQPVGWLLAHDVREGKGELNFSEFGAYTAKRRARKLEEIVREVGQGDMPMLTYSWMHPEARLTAVQRKQITAWAESLRAGIVPD